MLRYYKLFALFVLGLFTIVFNSNAQLLTGKSASEIVKGSQKVFLDQENGRVEFITLDQHIPATNPENWLKEALKATANDEFRLYETIEDDLGFKHFRYEQYYKGLPVEFSRYYIHTINNRIVSANGNFVNNIDLTATPNISAEDAIANVINYVGAEEYIWQTNGQTPQEATNIHLVIFPDKDKNYLAYKLDVYSVKPLSRNDIYVDALTGEILYAISKFHYANAKGTAHTKYSDVKTIETDSMSTTQFRLWDNTRGTGIETYDINQANDAQNAVDFIDADNVWDDTTNQDHVATDVHWGMGQAFDYFYNTHSRYSYDGLGAKIFNYVHLGKWLALSMWDGVGFYFGDGDGVNTTAWASLDIVAHEYTHAIIEYTAFLNYLYEAGAIQESICDIFAVGTDRYTNPTLWNYSIGEDISKTSTPLRNMISPKTRYQPDYYKGQYWDNTIGNEYINAGVHNRWFFLLAEGDTGINENMDTFRINGIGIDKAEKIMYRSLSMYLTPSSDFSFARQASIQAAIDLYGSCSPAEEAVTNAWWVVGVGNPYQKDSLEADFKVSNPFVCKIPAQTQFINTSTNATNFLWDFGDNTTSNDRNPQHVYYDTGYFNVTLMAWDTSSACGFNDTDIIVKKNYIYVKRNPVSAIIADTSQVNVGCQLVTLTDVSDDCVQGRNWIIEPYYYTIVSPDTNGKQIQVRFDSALTYHISLVQDWGLTSDTFRNTGVSIKVNGPKQPDFIASDTIIEVGLDTLVLRDLLPACGWNRKWTITPSTYLFVKSNNDDSEVSLIFGAPGQYTISLEVSYGNSGLVSTKTNYINVISYCTPTVHTLSADVGISRFQLGDIDKSSFIGQDAYTEYSNSKTTLYLNNNYTFRMERNTIFNKMNRKVWIDWNKDGDFNDAGEEVGSEGQAQTLVYSDNFMVPGNARLGTTVLRLGTSFENMSNTPCGQNYIGEFEDYRVEIKQKSLIDYMIFGQDTVFIEMCDNYVDSGYIIMSSMNVVRKIDTINQVNNTQIGSYTYTYLFTDTLGFVSQYTRIIVVQPATSFKGTLSLNGKSIDSIPVFSTYTDLGFIHLTHCMGIKATYTVGSVNSNIVGDYYIWYIAEQPNNIKDSISRKVVVYDDVAPVISLLGSDTMYVDVNSVFIDPGVAITDNYYSGLDAQVIGAVNTSIIGKYELYYFAEDSSDNYSDTILRVVYVGDYTPPVIKVDGYDENDTVFMEVFETLPTLNITITDNYSTSITETKSGTYQSLFGLNSADSMGVFTYIISAEDGSGNKADFNLFVKVEDKIAPVITLHGAAAINLASPKEFEDDSFTVSDNYDKNITVTRTGSYFDDYLINKELGFYTIKYNATDASGNKAAEKSRLINVNEYSSIGDIAKNEAFIIYPNPNNGQFTIGIKDNIQNLDIKVLNSLGQTIWTVQDAQLSNNLINIDLGQVKSGLYFVVIFDGQAEEVFKITVK